MLSASSGRVISVTVGASGADQLTPLSILYSQVALSLRLDTVITLADEILSPTIPESFSALKFTCASGGASSSILSETACESLAFPAASVAITSKL